ncbi:MAG: hypothetical protein Q8R35_04130, partial [bacterium]|nr:hypothetical protein [bacterium]
MRSMTSRNLWGGFFGGVLGILAFAWYPKLLPVGCFFGVIIGFWYGELAVGTLARLRTSSAMARRAFAFAVAAAVAVSRYVGIVPRTLSTIPPAARRCRMALSAHAAAIAANAAAAARWLRAHPMNRAIIAGCLAATAFIAANVAWLLPLSGSAFARDAGTDKLFDQWLFSFVMVGWLLAIVVPVWRLVLVRDGTDNMLADMAAYYRRYAFYASYGPLPFFCREVGILIGLAVLFWAAAGLLIAAVVALVAAMILIFLYAVIVGGGAAVVRLSLFRRDHWPCFLMTLSVTAISAWLTRAYLDGAMLWVVAVATGSAAGTITEWLRRAAGALISRSPSLEVFLWQPFGDRLGSSFDALFNGVDGVINRSLSTISRP